MSMISGPAACSSSTVLVRAGRSRRRACPPNTASLIVLLVTAFAFLAGLLVALGNTAGDLGRHCLSHAGRLRRASHVSPQTPLLSGLLALAGGLLQTAISLSTWPVRRYEPLRRAIANLYVHLGEAAASPVQASQAPPASAQSTLRPGICVEPRYRPHALRRKVSIAAESGRTNPAFTAHVGPSAPAHRAGERRPA